MVAANADQDDLEAGGFVGLVSAACRHVALLAATIAMGGSLFFSEVLGWIPCQLCWYQRILMYPITLLLTVGILRNDRGIHLYVLPLSLTGICVSLFHYLEVLQIIPPTPCSGSVPCSVDYINFVGPLSFVKIPFLALIAFIIISIMMGNYALAGDGGASSSQRGRSIANGAAIAIVAVVLLGFVLLGAVM